MIHIDTYDTTYVYGLLPFTPQTLASLQTSGDHYKLTTDSQGIHGRHFLKGFTSTTADVSAGAARCLEWLNGAVRAVGYCCTAQRRSTVGHTQLDERVKWQHCVCLVAPATLVTTCKRYDSFFCVRFTMCATILECLEIPAATSPGTRYGEKLDYTCTEVVVVMI